MRRVILVGVLMALISSAQPARGGSGSIDYCWTQWQASDGLRSLDLDGVSPGGVEQSFPTIFGHQYLITFDMAGNPQGSPAMKVLLTTADGLNASYSFTTALGQSTIYNMGWQLQSFTFTAPDSSAMLMFQSETPGSYGPALDNVFVSDISAVGTLGNLVLNGSFENGPFDKVIWPPSWGSNGPPVGQAPYTFVTLYSGDSTSIPGWTVIDGVNVAPGGGTGGEPGVGGEPPSGGGAPVPEPLTMVGVFLAVGAMGGYVRRWIRNEPAEMA